MRSTVLLLCLLLAPAACTPDPPVASFQGHTRNSFSSTKDFDQFCASPEHGHFCKVELTRFGDLAGANYALDPRFYSLHDEWYWFRLLNGVAISGDPVEPVQGLHFATLAEVYARFHPGDELPLGLQFYGDRLYSPRFYDRAGLCDFDTPDTRCPRFYGATELQHLPADPRRNRAEVLWLFALEYPDAPSESQLAHFFARLQAMLPADVASKLLWLARTSDAQEQLARQLRQSGGPFATRLLTYADLIQVGQTTAVLPGTHAGLVRRFETEPPGPLQVEASDVVLARTVPEDLPPVGAVLVTEAMLPLSDLARRLAGLNVPLVQATTLLDDAYMKQYANHASQKALVHDLGPQLRIQPLSVRQRETLEQTPLVAQPPGEPPSQETPGQGGPAAVRDLGWTGSALALAEELQPQGADAPWLLPAKIEADHDDPTVQTLRQLDQEAVFLDLRARKLLLDGRAAYLAAVKTDPPAQKWLQSFDDEPHTPVVKQVLAHGGAVRWLRDLPIEATVLTAIHAQLTAQFKGLGAQQALCLRASATDLDLPGLHPTARAFLQPDAQPLAADRTRTVATALAEVWSSRLDFASHEALRFTGRSPWTGHLAVVGRPCPPDAALQGVAQVHVQWRADGVHAQMTTQTGSEIVQVAVRPGQPDVVTRPETTAVLPEPTRMALQARALAITNLWRQRQNAQLEPAQRVDSQTVTLEWLLRPQGLVLTAVQLDPQTPTLAGLEVTAVPQDLLAGAVRVQRRTCLAENLEVRAIQVLTDPAMPWLQQPFFAEVTVQRPDWPAPKRMDHKQFTIGATAATLTLDSLLAAQWGMTQVPLAESAWPSGKLTCTVATLAVTRRGVLLAML